MKRLIVFDLDGTLAKSKSALDSETATLLGALLAVVQVAIISGGAWPQFEEQVLGPLADGGHLARLSLLPTCGTKFFAYAGSWRELYSEDLHPGEKTKILAALEQALTQTGLHATHTWGKVIEDRGTQITYSALGQEAPLDAKTAWDPRFALRQKLKVVLDALLPDFSVRLGGTTSVDITRRGIDKAYGIRKLRDLLGIALQDMLYIGDALFVGGNDRPALDAGVRCIQVRDPEETKRVIEALIACLEDDARAPGTSPLRDSSHTASGS
jgi:HAD superfamily hydrolase (TIGR01484 family)